MRGGSEAANEVEARLDRLLAESRRSGKPLLWSATAIEALAAGSTIAAALPPWLAGALLAGIPLASLSIYQQRRATVLARQVRELYDFDRKYVIYLSRWVMCESSIDGYWSGSHHGEREMVVLKPIRRVNWSITRRNESDLPFSTALPYLDRSHAERSGSGRCTFNAPHKAGTTLAFGIDFEPMLRVGETVSLEFDLVVPLYKPGTLALLRDRPSAAVPTPGETDFTSTIVSYPIEQFTKEVIIPERLGSRHHGIQVMNHDNDLTAESEYVRRHNCFDVRTTSADGESAWLLQLNRVRPPIGATYRVFWEPRS